MTVYLRHLGLSLHLTLRGGRESISSHGALEELLDLKLSYLLPLDEELLGVESAAASTDNLRLEGVGHLSVMAQRLVSCMRVDHGTSTVSMPEGCSPPRHSSLESGKFPLIPRVLHDRIDLLGQSKLARGFLIL